jgi:hypothetical protein
MPRSGVPGSVPGLQRTSSDLRLRAVAYAMDGGVAYIVGNYGDRSLRFSTPALDRAMRSRRFRTDAK